jgi:hypothetical protein
MQFRLPRDAVQNGSPKPILLIPFRQNEENRKNAKKLEKSWQFICICQKVFVSLQQEFRQKAYGQKRSAGRPGKVKTKH